jgi:hypothetical protein
VWRIRAQESRLERHLGREALHLVNGTAWLEGTSLRDGVVELDLAAPAGFGFHGLRFRAVDDTNHEHVYLRPHLSGQPDATQYTPVFNDVSGWQIHADARYQQPVIFPPDRWVHVRFAFRDRRLEVEIDGGGPLVFPHLVRDPEAGGIGIATSGAGAWFANVVVRSDPAASRGGGGGAEGPAALPGTVRRWRVSSPFPETEVEGVVELPDALGDRLAWSDLEAADRGVVNLARVATRTSTENTVFAAVTLRAERASVVPVEIGFSDRVRVFLSGRQLFAASDAYASRDYRFLGMVGYFDTLFLPLQEGDNELWMAVSEDFGGWAAALRLPESSDVRVVPTEAGRPADPGENRLTRRPP